MLYFFIIPISSSSSFWRKRYLLAPLFDATPSQNFLSSSVGTIPCHRLCQCLAIRSPGPDLAMLAATWQASHLTEPCWSCYHPPTCCSFMVHPLAAIPLSIASPRSSLPLLTPNKHSLLLALLAILPSLAIAMLQPLVISSLSLWGPASWHSSSQETFLMLPPAGVCRCIARLWS